MRQRTSLSLAIASFVSLTACGGGGGGGGGGVPEAEIGVSLDGQDPRSLPPCTIGMQRLPKVAQVDDVVRFRLTATLRSPTPQSTISIRLQNPPPGCTCAPVSVTAGSAAAEGRWIVSSPSVGYVRLAFRVATSVGVFRKTFDVRVEGNGEGTGILVGDVTGDGRLDTVALATEALDDDSGALFVFAGATNPSSAPTAVLRDDDSHAGDLLGSPRTPLVQLVDVTGDSILDVVAAVPGSDRSGVNAGVVLVWAGGAGLVGSVGPTCVLVAKTAVDGAFLGFPEPLVGGAPVGGGKLSILVVDVTGDGARDIVVAAPNDDGASVDSGSVFVFEGGAVLASGPAGSVRAEHALLVPPAGSGAARLGSGGQPIRVGDVNGDGVSDLLVSTNVVSHERLFVYAGGASLQGVVTPTASLRVNDAVPTASSQFIGAPRFAEIGDVDGDGIVDVVACANDVTVNGIPFSGIGCIWRGGASFTGDRAPDAVLRNGGLFGDQQGQSGLRLRDVTGDGLLDVLIAAPGFGGGVGEIRLWRGGPITSAAPAPVVLRQAAGATSGNLGGTVSRLTEPFAFGDVTGDAIDDLVVTSPTSTYGGAAGAGQVLVFQGGAGLALAPGSIVAPLSTLRGDAIVSLARGAAAAHGAHLEDLDGDGPLDVVVASLAGGSGNTRVECWRGGVAAFSAIDAPDRVLSIPLTLAQGELVTLCDLTGDGRVDVAVRTAPATTSAPCVEVFGGATIFTTLSEHFVLSTGDAETPAQRSGLNALFVPLLAGEVTGDGRMEIVGPDSLSNASGGGSGCVYLWNPVLVGAATSNPQGLPTLRIRGQAVAASGYPTGVRGSQGVVLADLTGDGILEVLVGHPGANAGDGEIGWTRSQPSLPTGVTTGYSGAFNPGPSADGLTR